MGRNIFYVYNIKTSSYDRVYPSKRVRRIVRLKSMLLGILAAIVAFALINTFILSPREKILKKENDALLSQYRVLERNLEEDLEVLSDIKRRDNNIYRVIFQAEPIESMIEEETFTNSNRYREFEKMTNADLVISVTKKIDILERKLFEQSNSFDEIAFMGKTHEERLKYIPAIQPILNKDLKKASSGYGVRIDPIYHTRKMHEGMDFTAKVGTSIFATGNGVVKGAAYEQGYGNMVTINHGYGYETRYAHMSKIIAKKGQKVKRGDVIGLVGSTGKSTAPHLHYEVRVQGKADNPMKYYYLDLKPEDYDMMIRLSNTGQVFD